MKNNEEVSCLHFEQIMVEIKNVYTKKNKYIFNI